MALSAVTVAQTVQTAQEALTLCRRGDYHIASHHLMKIKRNGRVLLDKSNNTCERLKSFEKWLSRRYTSETRELDELNRLKKEKESTIDSLEEKERHLRIRVDENRSHFEEARRNERDALRRKAAAEEKFDSIASPLVFIPGYALFWGIREIIENNSAVATEAANTASRYADNQRKLEQELQEMRNLLDEGRRNLSHLRSSVLLLERKISEEHAKLSQSRSWLSTIANALHLYSELAELAEEAVDSTEKLECVVKLAQKLKEEIEEAGAAQNYENSWILLDEFAQGEFSGMRLQYTCSSCQNTVSGVPLIINGEEVFCDHCV